MLNVTMPKCSKAFDPSPELDPSPSTPPVRPAPPVPSCNNVWPSTQGSLLLQLRGQGNASSWKLFVDIYMPLVYAFCRKRGMQHADASDVTQEVFVKLSDVMPRFDYDPETGYFRGWLGKVTLNQIRRHFRRDQSRVRGDQSRADDPLAERQSDSDNELWIEQFHDHLLRTSLERIRPEFSAECWSAFQMLWVEEKSTDDVAVSLGRDHNWLYKAKHRVMQRLEREVLFLSDDIPQFHR